MENQENMTYVVAMLKQISQTTLSLSQSQTMLIEQYKSLDQKYDSLDKKVGTLEQKYDSLDEKLDKYYEENRREHFEMRNILAHIQHDIKDLRTDIDTVYDLEKDSRKKIDHLI